MKPFIYKLILFLSIPVIIVEGSLLVFKSDVFSEARLNNIFSPKADGYQWVSQIKHPRKILLLGSSSVRYGLSCKILNKLTHDSLAFINLAMDARDPIETYFLLKNIDLTGVKAVYFGLDTWIFAKRYYKHRNSYMYMDMGFFSSIAYYFDHDKSLFIKRYKNFYKYIMSMHKPITARKFAKKKQKIPADFGSIALKSKARNFDRPIHEWYQLNLYGWSNLQFLYAKKLLSFCESEGIKFYAFVPPKRSDYTETYAEKCKAIHEEFVTNLVNLDFDTEVFGQFSQLDYLGDYDLFQEAFHLNENGQKQYSKEFYKMMQSPKEMFSAEYPWYNLDDY